MQKNRFSRDAAHIVPVSPRFLSIIVLYRNLIWFKQYLFLNQNNISIIITYQIKCKDWKTSHIAYKLPLVNLIFAHDDSLTNKRFAKRTEQLSKCFEPLCAATDGEVGIL